MNFAILIEKLAKYISEKRIIHSIGVSKTADQLADKYDTDKQKAIIAGILHDCARDIPDKKLLQMAADFGIVVNDFVIKNEPALLHAAVGAKLAEKEFYINDREIIEAIEYHTTGRANMGILEKIIFLADCIEPGRAYPGVEELRCLAFTDLNEALLLAFNQEISHLLSNDKLVHTESIKGRSSLILEIKDSQSKRYS